MDEKNLDEASETAHIDRRQFLAGTAAASLTVSTGWSAQSRDRVDGANRRLRLGIIGCGAQGNRLIDVILNLDANAVEIAAICDVFAPHRDTAATRTSATAHRHWQDLVSPEDLDGVLIATPDHLHAAMACRAMESGKDVYCEAPLARTFEEAVRCRETSESTQRVLQTGAAAASKGQWHTAQRLIAEGKIGPVGWCQSARDHNTRGGNAPRGPRPTRDTVDWDAFLGDAPRTPFDPERFLHWRRHWDYSSGIAAEQHFLQLAPMLIATGFRWPRRVSAAGGRFARDEGETPDSLMATVEYGAGQTVVLTTATANTTGQGAVVRGRDATIEFHNAHLRLSPEDPKAFEAAFGHQEQKLLLPELRPDPIEDWLAAMVSRGACACPPALACATQAAVDLAVAAYRRGETLDYDSATGATTVTPPRCL